LEDVNTDSIGSSKFKNLEATSPEASAADASDPFSSFASSSKGPKSAAISIFSPIGFSILMVISFDACLLFELLNDSI